MRNMLWESLPSSVSVKIQELLSKNAGRRIWQIPVYQTVTKAHFDTPFSIMRCVTLRCAKSCTYDKNGSASDRRSVSLFYGQRRESGAFFYRTFRVSAQPEGVSKRFRSGKTRQSTVTCYTLGMRVVGIWRFCRLSSVLGRPL